MRLLKSNHEEAETKMGMHAAYAADVCANNIVISSPDTDVLVLLTYHHDKIDATNLYFLTGHKGAHTNLKRYIPVYTICNQLSQEQLDIIFAVYCLTGCDTVSGVYGHGQIQNLQFDATKW